MIFFKIFSGKAFFFFLIILFHFSASSQENELSGEILDEKGGNLESANVLLMTKDNIILSFSISDKFGRFTIDASSAQGFDSLFLEVQHVAYEEERRLISENKSIYNFKLTPKLNTLEEVIIEDKPLAKRLGDTLIYNVQKFAKNEDRSIGDVLRRMPGILVASDGTIYYNNEEIENLYIHGDDLMAGKYGLATKVINKEDIVSVDVLRNHQPIKVLQDKLFSNRTSINLKLKDENKLKISAQAKLGLGIPEQYDVAFTPILLNKKVKFINQVASNNSGIDYRMDFKELGSKNMLSKLDNENMLFSLSQGTVGPPDLPTKDYYINTSSSINLNNLYTFKNGLKLRLNLQGLLDKNTLNYSNEIINYTGNDTVIFFENQNVVNRPNILLSSINLMKNEDDYFFNNNFKINYNLNKNRSDLNFNSESFSQTLKQDEIQISNDFSFIPQLRTNGIAEIRLLTEFNNKADRLDIGNDYQIPIAQGPQEYSGVRQELDLPSVYINGSLSYKIPSEFITQDYRIGYIRENRELNSGLFLKSDNTFIIYPENSTNNVEWDKNRFYFDSEFNFETDKIRASLSLPINYQTIHCLEIGYDLENTDRDLFFNPNAIFQYMFSVEKRLTLNYSHQTNFGNISQVFPGNILQNYRTVISNDSNLQKLAEDSFSLSYNLENSATLLFFNGGLTFRNLRSDNIRTYAIEDDLIVSNLLPFENEQTDWGLRLGLSKYLFKFKTKFSLDTRINHSTFENILNEKLVPVRANSIFLNSNFSKSFFDLLTFDYSPRAIWNFSKFSSNEDAMIEEVSYNTFRFEQNLNLTLTPTELLDIKVNSNYILIDQNDLPQNDYLLFNLNLQHRFKGNKFDLNLDVTNLFNVREYRLLNFTQNQQINSNYQLRGRMIIGRINWYF